MFSIINQFAVFFTQNFISLTASMTPTEHNNGTLQNAFGIGIAAIIFLNIYYYCIGKRNILKSKNDSKNGVLNYIQNHIKWMDYCIGIISILFFVFMFFIFNYLLGESASKTDIKALLVESNVIDFLNYSVIFLALLVVSTKLVKKSYVTQSFEKWMWFMLALISILGAGVFATYPFVVIMLVVSQMGLESFISEATVAVIMFLLGWVSKSVIEYPKR